MNKDNVRIQHQLKNYIEGVLLEIQSRANIIQEAEDENVDHDQTSGETQVKPEVDKEVQKIVHKIGMLQLHQLYNLVLIPYFKELAKRFASNGKANDPSRIPILSFYIGMDNVLTKLSSANFAKAGGTARLHNVTHQGWNQKLLITYQALIEANKQIAENVATAFKTMNLEPIHDAESVQEIEAHINTNVGAIVNVFNVLFTPLENGYIAQIKALIPEITKNPAFKGIDNIARQSADMFTTVQFKTLRELVKQTLPKFSGSWLLSNLETLVVQSNVTYQPEFGAAKSTHLLADAKNVKVFGESYNKIFKDFTGLINEYDKKLYQYSINLDLQKFVKDGTLDIRALRTNLRKTDVGFFNQKTNQVLKLIEKEVATHQKELFDKEAELERNKKQQEDTDNKRQEDETKASWSGVRRYLEENLHFNADFEMSNSQKELVSVVLRSLDTFSQTDTQAHFGGIGNEKDAKVLHDILKDAVIGNNGLVDFIQDWVVAVLPDECIMVGANKYTVKELVEDIKKDSLDSEKQEATKQDYDEDRASKPEALSTIFPIKNYHIKFNGHDLHWIANKALLSVYKNLVNWTFVDNLSKMSEGDWEEAIINDKFFQSKVFRTDEQGNVIEHEKTQDIQRAEEKLRDKGKGGFYDKDAADDLKKLLNNIDIGDKYKGDLSVADFRNMIMKYAGKDLLTVEKEKSAEIITILIDYLNKFSNVYGIDYNIRGLTSFEKRGKFFAENIMRHVSGNVDPKQVAQLGRDIEVILKLNTKEFKDKHSIGSAAATSEILKKVSNILNALKKLNETNIANNSEMRNNNEQ